ncbi:uncharacterized protein FOBCDRAFT_220010 [Fusarium oxysporum Fo47]|uniref:uncharacterized protein n=1 Tax=Fusarium oxysporum Fo47 TaxID=660027 RepID=UPI002869E38E|nr:uncharacterized protein FOBCDRAFT_220010 [Fusarium oxysporum Fo47]WJG35132.1 hypothetical protein FOBCDRAFT_220010 [Fusarium oxysporum Fo47]
MGRVGCIHSSCSLVLIFAFLLTPTQLEKVAQQHVQVQIYDYLLAYKTISHCRSFQLSFLLARHNLSPQSATRVDSLVQSVK